VGEHRRAEEIYLNPSTRSQIPVSDITELASGSINASGDSITVQLIQPTDCPSMIMIVWPAW